MTEKSHVGMGHDLCPVCCQPHNEAVLIDKRLRPTLTRHEVTGFALCPEHQAQKDAGYVFLVELRFAPQGPCNMRSTWDLRTGRFAALRAEIAAELLNQTTLLTFCTIPTMNALIEMQEPA